MYSVEFKEKMVAKLLGKDGPSVIELSNEVGASRSTIYKWVEQFKNNIADSSESEAGMNTNKKDHGNKAAIRPQNWSAEDKFNAVITTALMTEEEIGVYCRENGIYSHHLSKWRQLQIDGLKPSAVKEKKAEMIQLKSENKKLKKDLNRKDRALAETAALLILKKKAELIWENIKED